MKSGTASRRGVARRRLGITAAVAFVGVLWIPLYAALLGSITPFEEIGSGALLPRTLRWQNFVEIWSGTPLLVFFRNSAIYSLLVSVIVIVVAVPAAYSLARLRVRLAPFFVFLFLSTQMVPQIAVGVPLYNVVNTFRLVDTFAAVILVLSTLLAPLAVWQLIAHFKALPPSLEEAAMVDGTSRRGAVLHVLLPAAAPGVASAFIVTFTLVWEQFLIPILLVKSTDKLPLTVGVYGLFSDLVVPWNLVMAMTVVAMLPPILIYVLAQKYVVKELTAGAIRG